MELSQFIRLKSDVASKATAAQILELEDVVRIVVARQFAEMALARRSSAVVSTRTCPRCSSHDVVLHGTHKNGRQRFKCRECRRTYNILTGTPMARARKPEYWARYLGYMTDHLSIRKIIDTGLDINHMTAFRWRHRFLKAAKARNTAVLSGVIEADETFFVRSFKGSRGWKCGMPPADRGPRPSAWGALLRGLSHEQVPVLTALDSTGGVYEAILPSLSAVEPALDGRVAAGSVLCSDGAKAYVKAAVKAGAEHRRVMVGRPDQATKIAGKPRPPKGRLGLGHVNAHHERLKTFINRRCRGVATKYLGSYLAWNRAMGRDGFIGSTLLDYALA